MSEEASGYRYGRMRMRRLEVETDERVKKGQNGL